MTDIFTLINQLPDDDIRLQLAFFDSVTLTSAAKETGSRLLSGMADVANSFAQMFTDKLKVGYDYKKVSDMVDSRITELKAVKKRTASYDVRYKLMELVSFITADRYKYTGWQGKAFNTCCGYCRKRLYG